MGHVLTLNESQSQGDIDVADTGNVSDKDERNEALDSCSTYYSSVVGCLKEDSYFYQYYKAFWEDIYDEYEDVSRDDEDSYSDVFYEHEERFFRDYQGHDPIEDVADSFAHFIMRRPAVLPRTLSHYGIE